MSSNLPKLHDLSLESFASLAVELDLLPLFVKRYIERTSCSDIYPSNSQQIDFQKSFLNRENISDTDSLALWLKKNAITESQLSNQLFNALRLQLFKENKFKGEVEPLFLKLKSNLDKVIYSMIRCSRREKANELYFRLSEDEDSFAKLASEYSEGYEKQVNGLIGPIELGRINVAVAERLRISQEHQLWEPFCEQGWWLILKFEKLIPSKLDESMRNRLLNELYERWMRECVSNELSRLSDSEFFIALKTSTVHNTSNMPSSDSKTPSLFSKLLNSFNSSNS